MFRSIREKKLWVSGDPTDPVFVADTKSVLGLRVKNQNLIVKINKCATEIMLLWYTMGVSSVSHDVQSQLLWLNLAYIHDISCVC